ncbi:MAG: hypothetical protein MAG551_00668 [Candidatus Scalindua arabica]|uniref:Uncharacterized protein n=1 Tax=Candidatus Scalindua arabica TaxID=1127984 RepID=A0A942A357_9BACT|nr:hypothetical protein [Candidatus Scalindua arabica]
MTHTGQVISKETKFISKTSLEKKPLSVEIFFYE